MTGKLAARGKITDYIYLHPVSEPGRVIELTLKKEVEVWGRVEG